MEEPILSEYEQIRLQNIRENRRSMIELGLLSEEWDVSPGKENKRRKKKTAKRKRNTSENLLPTRRSLRLSNCPVEFSQLESDDEGDKEYKKHNPAPVPRPKRPNEYGEISGIAMGQSWDTRLECSRDGVHRPTVAGIHPGPDGAYSVVLSGNYDDDKDNGYSFVYTGSGGRDLRGTKTNPKNLRTAPQSKDQILNPGNAALIKSVENQKPVRVIRGYKLTSDYAPEEGYRYDGLFLVEKWWLSEGKSGFQTYKFKLKRCEGQAPAPWETLNSDSQIASLD